MVKPLQKPEELLNIFLKKEGLAIVPARPKVTFTDDGGVIITPSFGVIRVQTDEASQDKV